MKNRRPGALFLSGLMTGLVLSFILVAGSLIHITRGGLVVILDVDEIAQYIGGQIETQAASELPRVVEEMKAQVPDLVKERMQMGNTTAEIKISDINIVLPPSALSQFDQYLQSTVQTTVYRLLDGMDLTALSRDLGEQAADMVKTSLGEELQEKRVLSIRTWWGEVPVILEIEGDHTPITGDNIDSESPL